MTYVVTDNCINCKYTDCVEVCHVDCFYEGENMLVIHPDECIDCGVCEPECPADAIRLGRLHPALEPGIVLADARHLFAELIELLLHACEFGSQWRGGRFVALLGISRRDFPGAEPDAADRERGPPRRGRTPGRDVLDHQARGRRVVRGGAPPH